MKAALIICTLAVLVCAGYAWHVPRIPACPAVDNPEAQAILIPSPWNCASYFECSNGTPYLMHCPKGLYYDIPRRTCNYAEKVNCGHRGHQDFEPNNL